ncbi:ureidoglycolate lyase [Jiella sonneratiae]|uniref:Ureidoglycolate lyase n=1 Tax=Jiella sonneratiae TaxID=2816856 RepID=A0ABS3J8L8_9HYPH|nr:ureidoglycolate lyase [Jiella sonneratiae]MBO0906018.1 ureidoglycolate lyase [Jiella sonneratiae]
MQIIRPAPLTRAAFAPFGDVIDTDGADAFPINAGMTTRFHDLATVDVAAGAGRPAIAIFRSTPVSLPFDIALMERHPLASQAFFPLAPRPWLVVVADDEAGRPGTPLAFLATGAQGVNYGRNVWHHPLLALESVTDFLIVDRGGADNLEEFSLEAPVRIEG